MRSRQFWWSVAAAVLCLVPVYLWHVQLEVWRTLELNRGWIRFGFDVRTHVFWGHILLLMSVAALQVVLAARLYVSKPAPAWHYWIGVGAMTLARCFFWVMLCGVLGALLAGAFGGFIGGLTRHGRIIWSTATLATLAILAAAEFAKVPARAGGVPKRRPHHGEVAVAFLCLLALFWIETLINTVILDSVGPPQGTDRALAVGRRYVAPLVALGVALEAAVALGWAWWVQRPDPTDAARAAVFE